MVLPMVLETELEELIAPLEELEPNLSDFSGSLDYIDSLANKPSLSIKSSYAPFVGRDTIDIANESYPLSRENNSDNRRWSPDRISDIGEKISNAASLIPVSDRIATPENPYTPDEIRKIIHSPDYEKANYHPLAPKKLNFSQPNFVEDCIKRKRRREAMFAAGLWGIHHFKHRRMKWSSRFPC